jgi:hypothetical protein
VRRSADGGSYEEFPAVEGLEDFDPADRKFVAVACAHPERPPVLQGLDSKWWGWRTALAAAGVVVRFVCESEIRGAYARKAGEA